MLYFYRNPSEESQHMLQNEPVKPFLYFRPHLPTVVEVSVIQDVAFPHS